MHKVIKIYTKSMGPFGGLIFCQHLPKSADPPAPLYGVPLAALRIFTPIWVPNTSENCPTPSIRWPPDTASDGQQNQLPMATRPSPTSDGHQTQLPMATRHSFR